jgi:hypothetical protein
MTAAAKDANNTTVRGSDFCLAAWAEWSEARRHEPVLFFMFYLHPTRNEQCGINDFSSLLIQSVYRLDGPYAAVIALRLDRGIDRAIW